LVGDLRCRAGQAAEAAVICLSLGAGLNGEQIKLVEPRDVVDAGDGRLAVHVKGDHPRQVPVREAYTDLLRRAVDAADDSFFGDTDHSNMASNAAARVPAPDGGHLRLRRARVTWLQAHLCYGNAVATSEQLIKIQAPPVGTIAHQMLQGNRNPVEGTHGVLRNRHGLQHNTCRAPGLIPHALAAAITAAVRSLQLTLDDELKRRRDHRRNKTERKTRNKTRRAQQAPHDDRPAPAEQPAQSSESHDQEPHGDTEAGSGTLTPPRAPP
jgi:hypothetical protein